MLDPLHDPGADAIERIGVPDGLVTGIAADDMYRMSRLIADALMVMPLSLNAHRVFHGLLHATCRQLSSWSPEVRQPDQGYRLRCVPLRERLGLLQVNGNRNLQAGVMDLKESGMFQSLTFLHDNTWLSWRFRDDIISAVLDDHAYGLLDASVLPRLKSRTSYHIVYLASMVRRMRRPTFSFLVPHAGIWIDKDEADWSDVSDGIIKSLRIFCGHYNLLAVVLLQRRGLKRGIDMLEIRLRGSTSLWSMKQLGKCDPTTTTCLVIDGERHIRTCVDELPAFLARLREVRWHLGDIACIPPVEAV